MTAFFSKKSRSEPESLASASPLAESAALSGDDFATLARILHSESGIALQPSKTGLVISRLSKRLRELGIADFATYVQRVEADETERMAMVSALTTNVTGFFREAHHFDLLAKSYLPQMVEAARQGGRLRIWSSACSTGEEPYSIAMTILELCPEAANLDIRILATDIDPAARAIAEKGIYPVKSCETLSLERRQRFTDPVDGEKLSMQAPVRRLVTFNGLNLVGNWPMTGKFDVIFCRNVVIYFNTETRAALWRRFAEKLTPRGLLFIGHSERIDTASEALFENVGLTTYRLQ